MLRLYHQWRARKLKDRLAVEIERGRLLYVAHKFYCVSYYTDRWHDSVLLQTRLNQRLRYHFDRS